MSDTNKETLYSLQILRAIAAFFVVYFHTASKLNDMPIFGSYGVDIFFVLSGFIMALIVSKHQSPKLFAINRIIRIVPLYWFLTSVIYILILVKPKLFSTSTANFQHYLNSLLFIPDLNNAGTMMPVISQGWTLNYEMFFYLSVFLSLCFFRKALFILPIVILSMFYIFSFSFENKIPYAFFSNKIVFEFVFGMLSFKLYQRIKNTKLPPLLLISILLICFSFLSIAESNAIKVDRLLLFGIPSLIILIALLLLENAINIKNKFIYLLLLFGDASYAIYLSHLYLVQFIYKVLQAANIISLFNFLYISLSIISSAFIGYILYKYIDLPFRQYIRKKIT